MGGFHCNVHTVRMQCARSGKLSHGQGNCGDYCVPIHRTAQIPIQSQDSDNELKQTMFQTENPRVLSEPAVFALCTYASRLVGGFQGGHRKANFYWALCLCRARAVQKCPLEVHFSVLMNLRAAQRPVHGANGGAVGPDRT